MGVQLTQEMILGAQRAEKEYGVPASISLAQIVLESGGSNPGGLSGLAYNAKNLFGIKAGSSWAGAIVRMLTTEYGKGNKPYKTYANFRKYNSYQESIVDHAKLLKNSRYTKHTNSATTLEEYARGIKAGGYATDANYAQQLVNIINKQNLNKYDGGSVQNIIKGATGGTSVVGGGTNVDTTVQQTSSSNLKWWGNIVVVVIVILLIGVGLVFFVGSFGGVDNIDPVSKTKKFVKKGA
ncbi:glucosaminidase domain-containing protein [Clostridioides difficile]|nr:glucosaminidase domain-containing protein [Clostridioides difficile]MCL0945069.1 glucosaminidase domain-containing protein [Clostridioides difficile]MDI2847285.1 glucosaminidase domain-containing protein [Clostridioides difficile]